VPDRRKPPAVVVARAAAPLVVAALVLVPGAVAGCAHRVRIDSNVPEAAVRVDGVDVGRVVDGASFVERAGFAVAYDVEVRAPGYVVARRRLHPTVVDPAVGVPALLGAGVAGVGGCCVLPVVGVAAGGVTPAALPAWGAAALLAGGACGAGAVAFGASSRLPDVVSIPLQAEVGVGADDDLPPPPVDEGAGLSGVLVPPTAALPAPQRW
jgi:hypothetical protein